MDWTPEAIEALRGFWSEGHSTAEIGRRMGISKNAVVGKAHRLNLSARPSPIRRDAVVAPRAVTVEATALVPTPAEAPPAAPATETTAPIQVEAAEPAPAPRASTPAAPPAPAPRPVAPVMVRPAAPPARKPTPITLPNAVVRAFPRSSSRSCCWPIGEPGTPSFCFCTSEAVGNKPYCAEHSALAYVKVRDRREDAA